MWRTHVLFGMASLWVVSPIPNLLTNHNVGPLAAFAAFGALLPDLDADASKIRSLSWGGVRPFVPLSTMLNRWFGHRGLLHSPIGLCIAGCAALGLTAVGYGLPALATWIGYMSHLAADACTRTGIPGWPNNSQDRLFLLPVKWRITTGSSVEEALLPLLALVVLGLMLSHYPPM